MTVNKYAADYAAVIYGYSRDTFEEVFRFFSRIAAAYEESAGFRHLLSHPALSMKQKISAATAIGGVCPHIWSDILLPKLISKGHIRFVPQITEQLDMLRKVSQGTVVPHVRSAQPLTAPERERLAAVLARFTGKTVEPVFESDPRLIAGYEILIGSLVIDNSIRRDLSEIKQRLNACKQG